MSIIERLRAWGARPGVRAVGLRVVLIIAAISASYLVLANLLLQTRAIRDLVSKGPDVELSYESAYSLWPGRVSFERLELVAGDYNVQLAVGVSDGTIDVSLHELFFKRFHAVALTLDGVSFRLRHKVHAVGDDRARVEAFPPIAGYPDPPLYTGPKPPSMPGEEDKLWRIGLKDIRATLSELWIQEYRYVGPGQIEGGFDLAPGRAFEVFPANVRLTGGELTLGSRAVAGRFTLGVAGEIAHTETDQGTRSMFQNASIQVDLTAGATDLSLLDLYLGGEPVMNVAGHADIDAHLAVAAGRVETSSRAALGSDDVSVATPYGRVVGSVALDLTVPSENTVQLVTTSPGLRLENDSGHKPPAIETAKLTLSVGPADLTSPLALRHLLLELPRVTVPSLGWSDGVLSELGADLRVDGRLEGEATVGLTRPAGPTARVRLRVVGGRLERKALRAALSGHFDLELAPETPESPTSTGSLVVELDGVRVMATAAEKSNPFRAAVRTHDLRVNLEPEPKLSGTVAVQAAPADSLLSLVLGSPLLEELAASVFDLKRLDASARMKIDQRSTRLELSRAESGGLKGEGFWQSPAKGQPNGEFLVMSDVANVGVVLRGSETETDLFVSDDWLTRRGAADARPSPSRRRKPRRQDPAP